MAARGVLDTAGNEGELQKASSNDVIERLKSNRLDKFIEYVGQNNLVMEDFLSYNEVDIELRRFRNLTMCRIILVNFYNSLMWMKMYLNI